MQREINMIFGENHRFMEGKQGEHDKEVKKDHEVLSRLMDDSML
jgi:hypothetical protein